MGLAASFFAFLNDLANFDGLDWETPDDPLVSPGFSDIAWGLPLEASSGDRLASGSSGADSASQPASVASSAASYLASKLDHPAQGDCGP